MVSQFFAQYILNKGLLTPAQVQVALESRRTAQPKLGVTAINMGYLTAEQVEKIHKLQYRIDKRFGEIALIEGYLSHEQLSNVLANQENDNFRFGQALVDKGFLSLEALEDVLAEYKQAAELEQPADLILIKEWISHYLSFPREDDNAVLYCDYMALFLRAIVRFLDACPLLVASSEAKSEERWAVSQSLTGDIDLHSCLLIDDSVLLEIAKRYSCEQLLEIDELALDSVGEFLNVTNGLFCINLSNLGLDCELHPQMIARESATVQSPSWSVTVDIGFGTIELVLTRE